MAVSKSMLEEVQAQAFQDEKGKSYFTEALSSVMDVLEKFPPSVMCMVGKMVSDEGAYRLILRLEEGEEDWESWYKTLY